MTDAELTVMQQLADRAGEYVDAVLAADPGSHSWNTSGERLEAAISVAREQLGKYGVAAFGPVNTFTIVAGPVVKHLHFVADYGKLTVAFSTAGLFVKCWNVAGDRLKSSFEYLHGGS